MFNGQGGLHVCPGVTDRLVQYLLSTVDCSNVSADAIRLYARTRSFIRMRYLLEQADEAKFARKEKKRKRKL